MMKNKKIIVIDQTIREGMQYKGIVFSLEQRKKILSFQEKLGVDICQAGYPPAHSSEENNVKLLNEFSLARNFTINIAAMGRALLSDVKILINTGIKDFHLHIHIKEDISQLQLEKLFEDLSQIKDHIKKNVPLSNISVAMLDLGKTRPDLLSECVAFFGNQLGIELLSLPDTSGIMAPNEIDKTISPLIELLKGEKTKISVHCHNDMGMANANTIMGVNAGAKSIEVSALGIGERNGIADLYVTCRVLKSQGYHIQVNTEDMDTFKEYYQYINQIAMDQVNEQLLNYNTPVFGDAVKTHVAGTHASTSYGISDEQEFYINVLCGRHLIKKYLIAHGIKFHERCIERILMSIKNESALLGRRLKLEEISSIVSSIS